eukprot:TRINITY_DN1090_c0_g1_i1.p1 TRINITY_DN1090_c0_g1~~TRINITY_DN1090_c0_g1_i1.p1  ORF type:complete len:440 (+),score=70.69 TRINITY_DN1090_c0_g1_i1:123-1442(+)
MNYRILALFIISLIAVGIFYQTFYESIQPTKCDVNVSTKHAEVLGSTGHLYRAKVVRAYPIEYEVPIKKEKIPLQGTLKCSHWIALTTIQPPTTAVLKMSELEEWCLIVVADRKTPPGYLDTFSENARKRAVYLTPAQQDALPYAIGKLLPWNHYGRKNIAYLYAIHHGAKVIYDTDDDNEVTTKTIPITVDDYRSSKQIIKKNNSEYVYNLYPIYTPSHTDQSQKWFDNVWPRGFPLEKIKDSATIPSKFGTLTVAPSMIQILQQHDPDVDAIYRLTQTLPLYFQPQDLDLVNLPVYGFAPYNAQSSVWSAEGMWGLYLPITVTGRVSDIWRSYFMQRLLWDSNHTIAYAAPRIVQERNPHSYLADLDAEKDLYEKADELLRYLLAWKSESTSTLQRYYELMRDLYTIRILEKEDVILARAWIQDLQNINYQDIKITH